MASIVVNGDTSGAVTLSAPAIAGTTTLTLPTFTGTLRTTNVTFTSLTSGSGTYTVPTGCKTLWIRMVGAGGGGGGGGNNGTAGNGGIGGSTTFGTSLLTCTGGQGLTTSSNPGSATLNSPAIGIAASGASGGGFGALVTSAVYLIGGTGGASPFGGNGTGGANSSGGGGSANSGSGGAGGGNNGSAPAFSGGGGGSGGYIDAFITSPSATYSYAIGTGGTAGTAGTNGFAGGVGGSGVIYITEYY